jgi:3-methylcrotonyl-CoA carboxylase alpha subunit
LFYAEDLKKYIMRKIRKVLVANRGEIAVRIFDTLRKMGIKGVAVYSEHDATAMHVRKADQSVKLEGVGLTATYLNISQLIAAAGKSQVDAIHPGYGFLSESPDFAEAVEKAGYIFIGPGHEAIRIMGNKVQARALVDRLGIPVIKGISGPAEALLQEAHALRYPLLVKAAAGGGGKGMRIVHTDKELEEALEPAGREALNYFGNKEIYLEQFLENPRHIEVQLLADQHGKAVTLFERECSVQRRYQKIIEEAPAPFISQELRTKLADAAILIAKEINYSNAGTIEFLVSGDAFFFLEMNTRIQVEHPVTEMITGLDIVQQQIYIASGTPLLFDQEDIQINGHAIEARVYAEDPSRGFMPAPGNILLYLQPEENGLRIDTAIDSSVEISSNYDPMISKVISHAPTREKALDKLLHALNQYTILGISTNLSFLSQLIKSPGFIQGNTDTGFCQRFMDDGFEPHFSRSWKDEIWVAAYLFVTAGRNLSADGRQNNTCVRPMAEIWKDLGYWRLIPEPVFVVNERLLSLPFTYGGPGKLSFKSNGDSQSIFMLQKDDTRLSLEADGNTYLFHYVYDKKDVLWLKAGDQVVRVTHAQQLNRHEMAELTLNPDLPGEQTLRAPMNGKILKVHVRESDIVNKGDTLLILESMKMENRIAATAHARVGKIMVEAGQAVASNDPLIFLAAVKTEKAAETI